MFVLFVAAVLAADPSPKELPAAEASAKKIKELQKERIAVLTKAADASIELATHGRREIEEALEDRLALLRAQVEAAEKESDRIALYLKTLESLTTYEKVAKKQFEAGRGTELAVHKIKARRLEVEIQLERAKLKEAQEKK